MTSTKVDTKYFDVKIQHLSVQSLTLPLIFINFLLALTCHAMKKNAFEIANRKKKCTFAALFV